MVSAKALGRVQVLVWVLIYGGLLTLVAGLAVLRVDTITGLVMAAAGGVLAAAGVTLIWVRSRLRADG